MICSSCPQEFEKGKICNVCSKLYCSAHDIDICPFCQGKLEDIENEIEKIGDIEVNWLSKDGIKRVGISGLNFLPPYFMKLDSVVKDEESSVKIILFDSKESSVNFEKIFHKKHKMKYPDRLITKKSRYTILMVPDIKQYFLLLNTSSLHESTALFLALLNHKIMNQVISNDKIFCGLDDELVKSIGEVFLEYNRKLGIPFLSFYEDVEQITRNQISNISQDYCETRSIQELLKTKEFNNEIGNYLKHKIELVFTLMDFDARFLLFEVFQTVEKILHITILLAGISSDPHLKQYLMNVFEIHYNKFKKKYNDLPDLLEASDYIIKKQSTIVFSNYKRYVHTISKIITGSFSKIEPKYVSLAETIDLFKLTDYFLKNLENGELVNFPRIGTIHQYVELLENILNKEEIYPEIRIYSGFCLENIFLNWLQLEPSSSRFEKLANLVRKLAILIENKLPEIKIKNRSFEGLQGSPLKYEDAALKLLSVYRLAESFGRYDIKNEFYQRATKITDEHDLAAIQAFLLWYKFVQTQNFSYLSEVHNIIQRIDVNSAYNKHILVPINLLIQTLLYQEQKIQNINEGQKILIDSTSEGTSLQTQAQASLRTTEAFYHLLEMFKHLIQYQNKPENLKKAYYTSLALSDSLNRIDPIHIMPIKTKILYKVQIKDYNEVNYLCKKLEVYSDPEGYITEYVNLVKRWGEISSKEKRSFMYRNKFQYDGKDLWVRILCTIINDSMNEDFNNNIAGKKALILVEGLIDQNILETFIEKLYPEHGTIFMDLEGFQNYRYYATSRFIDKLKIPSYMIFDGDTRNMEKKEAINQIGLSIPPNNIYTLNQYSIENYILNPKSIVTAYCDIGCNEQEIRKFIIGKEQTKNKKRVMKALFKQFKLGSYNKDEAKKIAQATESTDINYEIKQLLEKIVNLKDVNSI